jgi:hypothetical protein
MELKELGFSHKNMRWMERAKVHIEGESFSFCGNEYTYVPTLEEVSLIKLGSLN